MFVIMGFLSGECVRQSPIGGRGSGSQLFYLIYVGYSRHKIDIGKFCRGGSSDDSAIPADLIGRTFDIGNGIPFQSKLIKSPGTGIRHRTGNFCRVCAIQKLMVVVNTIIIRIIAGINVTVAKITVHPFKKIAVLTLITRVNRENLTGGGKIAVCINSNNFVAVLVGGIIQRKPNCLFVDSGHFHIPAKNFETCCCETWRCNPIPTQIEDVNAAVCTQIVRIRCTGNYKICSGLRRWRFRKAVRQIIV